MFRTLTISILTGILAAANAVSEEKSGDNAGFADTLGATQPDGWTQKAARLDHLRRAIEHLEAAGLTELAAKVDEHAETEVLHAELEQKRIELLTQPRTRDFPYANGQASFDKRQGHQS